MAGRRIGYPYAESLSDEPTYDTIERPEVGNKYGTFRQPLIRQSISMRPSFSRSNEGGYLDGTIWRSKEQTLRDEPVTLSDGTKTIIHPKIGNYAILVIVLFIVMVPVGICVLPLLPFLCTKYTNWMKDAEHIDPISNNLIGVYKRGIIDSPSIITFYREPEILNNLVEETEESFSDERTSNQRHSNRRCRQSSRRNSDYAVITNQPIKLHIVFRKKSVLLPDGETTIVRRRIGACNFIGACVTCLLGFVCFPFPILCFLMPCCKDVEHIHPKTREIVGTYYRCIL